MFGLFKRKDTVKNPAEATETASEAPKPRKTGSTSSRVKTPAKTVKNTVKTNKRRVGRPSTGSRKANDMSVEEKQALLDSARVRSAKNTPGKAAPRRKEKVPAAPRHSSGFRVDTKTFNHVKKLINAGEYTRKQITTMTGVSPVTVRRIASASNITEYKTLQAIENSSWGDNDSTLEMSRARTRALVQKRAKNTPQTQNKRVTKTPQKRATKKSHTLADDLSKEGVIKSPPAQRMSANEARAIAKMKVAEIYNFLTREAESEEHIPKDKVQKHNDEVMEELYKKTTEFRSIYRASQMLSEWEKDKNISY